MLPMVIGFVHQPQKYRKKLIVPLGDHFAP